LIKLSDYLEKKNIICSTSSDVKQAVNTLVSDILKENDENCSLTEVRKEFSDLITIDLNNGFLISHSRLEKLKDIHIGLITFGKSVKYNKKDVKAVFCILVPQSKHRAYLSILAHISRLFSRPKAKEIFSCENVDKIAEFVREMEG